MATDNGLSIQNLETLDVTTLTPLTPEVISRQATINFGTIGHVAHGKSTVVRAISGIQTTRFFSEKSRNITIKLGYANAKIYKCDNPKCTGKNGKAESGMYSSRGSAAPDVFPCEKDGCTGSARLIRHVSFVDCPGHDVLMATMLNGAAVMDAALLLVAGNEPCPQPQTSEHLAAVEIMRLKHIIILQNKVELVKEAQALEQYEQIVKFAAGTAAGESPIIPISAVLKYNIDVLLEYMCTQVPAPLRDFTSKPQMIVIRSFDVNKPGEEIDDLQGGVAGGSILKGVLRLGDAIEVRPGIIERANPSDSKGVPVVKPIRSKVVSLFAEANSLQYAVPGGLIGVGTTVDPTLTRSDKLVGQVLGHADDLPEVYHEIEIKYYLLRRMLGIRSGDDKDGKGAKVSKLKSDEPLLLNIGSTSVTAKILKLKEGESVKLQLNSPVCTRVADSVAISRRVEKNWRLVGWGEIVKGKTVDLQ
eukprot:GDKJ01032678.1.p1 GENE.GDKJ01032678.1~~GDKJ01032678.1.p1  ORF type:complete len:474 (+),score=127.73 GDKJ01032678.1:28-1449(+)